MTDDQKARTSATRFYLSLDDEDGATPLDAAEVPPIDFPLPLAPAASRPSPAKDVGAPSARATLLEQIRDQLRAGRKGVLSPAQAEPSRAEPSRNEPPRALKMHARAANSPSSKSRRTWLGPVAMVVGALLAYVASTTSLGLLAPSGFGSGSRKPRVPDLGTLNPPSEAAASAAAPGVAPVNKGPSKKGDAPAVVETTAMPEGLSYPGRGLLEVVTSERELVYVDGIFIGRGPLRRIPLQPGPHAILIRSGGTDRTAQAQVQAAKSTVVHFETTLLGGVPGAAADPSELDDPE